jgi:hypothetical protein
MGTDAGTLTSGVYQLTATAQYVNNTFKIFYKVDGATSGVEPAIRVAEANTEVTLAPATSFARTFFAFDGWSDGATVLAENAAFQMPSANTTLLAQWEILAPTVPTVTAVGSDGGATITVSAGNGGGGLPDSYLVTASPGGATCTVFAPLTSCSISPLTNGQAYTFSVTATNSSGTSTAATSGSITPAGSPEAPTSVNAVSGNASVTGSFVAPTNTGGPAITSYTVTSSPADGVCTVNVSAATFSCTGLTNGTAYTFAVTASNGVYTSVASTSSASVIPATVPDVPTSVTAASTTSGSATISFVAPVNNGGSAITGYTITSAPAGAVCTLDANTSSFACTGLTDGTPYTYTVRAVNAVGNSEAVTTAALTTQRAASAPATISATTGDTKATITFCGAVTNGSTITSYTVQAYDSTDTALTGLICTVTTSAAGGSCEVTGLTNGSSYTFRAVTNSTANSAAVSSAVSIPTAAIIPAKAPDAPTGLEVTAGTGKITVSWQEPASNGSTILSYSVQAYDAAGNAVTGAICTVTAPALTCDVSTNLLPANN